MDLIYPGALISTPHMSSISLRWRYVGFNIGLNLLDNLSAGTNNWPNHIFRNGHLHDTGTFGL